MMKILSAILSLTLLSASTMILAGEATPDKTLSDKKTTAPYLLPNAPTFDLTLTKFRTSYNQKNPTLLLDEYHSVALSDKETNITRAASKIDEMLYSSVALEKGTGKIKSLQITYISSSDDDQTSRTQAINYMAAIMREFATAMTREQSIDKVAKLLEEGKGQRYFAITDGALRYVISDDGEKGVTFAVEPIKLSLFRNAS